TIVHVVDVQSGLACDCRCPACGGNLVAHKGDARRYHFVHHAVRDCRGATETSLHKLAKQILDEGKRLRVPEVRADDEGESLVKYPEKEVRLDATALERRLEDIVPDVIARQGDRELLVEFAVTHYCDAHKIERIRRLGIAAIEIDLSGILLNTS